MFGKFIASWRSLSKASVEESMRPVAFERNQANFEISHLPFEFAEPLRSGRIDVAHVGFQLSKSNVVGGAVVGKSAQQFRLKVARTLIEVFDNALFRCGQFGPKLASRKRGVIVHNLYL